MKHLTGIPHIGRDLIHNFQDRGVEYQTLPTNLFKVMRLSKW